MTSANSHRSLITTASHSHQQPEDPAQPSEESQTPSLNTEKTTFQKQLRQLFQHFCGVFDEHFRRFAQVFNGTELEYRVRCYRDGLLIQSTEVL